MHCKELMMKQLLRHNCHQKKWLKYKHRQRLRPMPHQQPRLPFRPLVLESSQLLRRHRLKLRLKQRQMLSKPQLPEKSATPKPPPLLNNNQSQLKMKPLLLLQQNHTQVPKSNFLRTRLSITLKPSLPPPMPCSKRKNHGRR